MYKTLVVDPPWKYRDKLEIRRNGEGAPSRGASAHYGVMSLEDIAAVDVGGYACENSHLYLWTTNAFLSEAHDLAKGWGFNPRTVLTWVKGSWDHPSGRFKHQIGMGHYLRNNTEHALLCVRGSLLTLRNDVPSAFFAPRTRHSEKPDAFFDLVETLSPGPYVSIFERRLRLGWDAIGDELGETLAAPTDRSKGDSDG